MNISTLISRLKKRDESAFNELILTYSKRLMTVAKVYSNSIEDAEDVLQDALIVIFQKVSTFKGEEEKLFYAWMKRIAINLALSKHRKKYRHMEQSLEESDIDQAFDAQIISNLNKEDIMKLVFDLPAGYRQVFALFAIEGYSHKEIAEQLNIGTSSSRSQFVRAKRILQTRINHQLELTTS